MKQITLNSVVYNARPIVKRLIIDDKFKGSLVVDDSAPLLFGSLSVSLDYTLSAPSKLIAKLYSDDATDKVSDVINLSSDEVGIILVEEIFFDSITIDDNFNNDKVSVLFNGYELTKKQQVSKLELLPLVNNGIYVAPDDGGCGFSEEVCNRLEMLVFDGVDRSLSNNVNNFEKGLLTNITFNWNVEADDDVLTSVLFDGVDKSANLVGNQVFNGVVSTITKMLAITLESGNNPSNVSSTAYARIPQFSGSLPNGTNEPVYTQVGLNGFAKVISSSTTINKVFNLVNQYAFFITNNANASITDLDTNFSLSVGAFASTTDYFIKKTVNIFLADGTQEAVTLYRTRTVKTQTLNLRIS